MDCFQDFCLHCDRDSPDGPYCSQKCKLADLERSNSSSPTSPTSQAERNWTQMPSNYAAPSSSSSRPRSSYFMYSQQPSRPTERQLTPSSSRTSLSSTSSYSTASGTYSTEAKAQLNDYFSSFDQAKAAKRRSSTR
ncbi:hypothetical protein CB0940_05173 [Cercospora beticola]|uniref:Uncharacterized protein n=1 Tax=Cercospora beticola TaxID=122368 RepID=A0A2G5HNL3_CERBT|nr:hypothetical protein CB0940_05173 [Cercospora beticola]PIA93833.1 hypothetical protein CB0940_05173 [Cercospora beticola]WPB02484.1 hypothetical protein RHO25_007120 [Cercospora beticola]